MALSYVTAVAVDDVLSQLPLGATLVGYCHRCGRSRHLHLTEYYVARIQQPAQP